jgi:G:T-mismatch repair DNA endonuclease (very short patch repair protein)
MIKANTSYWATKSKRTVKTTQDWTIGNVVKVGFLTLRVIACEAIKDGMPDIYTLESLDSSKRYEFIPHNGLTRI